MFRKALTNTAIYALFSVPLDLIVAFIFALLLNLKIPGRTIFRTAFYFPAIIPSVATAILWSMLLSTKGGLVNIVLRLVGVERHPLVDQPDLDHACADPDRASGALVRSSSSSWPVCKTCRATSTRRRGSTAPGRFAWSAT